MEKRIVFLRIVLALMIFILAGRLFYIQVVKYNFYSEKAMEQRIKSFKISEKRGDIYDRNMIPFTDRDYKEYVFAIPKMINDKKRAAEILSEITEISSEKIKEDLKRNKDYIRYEIRRDVDFSLPVGIFKLELPQRYSSNSLARHVIGYLGDKKMGLEESFDEVL
ncbi:MAG TPA: cell division protein FtsI, partial [Caldanaerobacter subterraneus]|nr:cell division protein FtsI [Caldanaerobacter subterraneus]